MSKPPATSRTLVLFAIAIPLALVLGVLLATPYSSNSLLFVGLVLAFLSVPLFLRWHHPILIVTWNASASVFFLPGRPQLWMLVGAISLAITVLGCILNKEQKFHHVPAVTWPLLALLGIVVLTAKLTGGIGLRTLGGSQYGGKGYAYIVAAVIAYFALSSVRIPTDRAQRYAFLFLISGIGLAVSNLAYLGGPDFWFLFRVFPVDMAMSQALEDFNPYYSITRITGLGFAAIALCNVFLLRFGIRGMLDFSKPWRLLLFLIAFAASLAGGFRTALVLVVLSFVVQFFIEGLHRTRFLLVLTVAGVLGMAALIPVVSKLPMAAQRALSIVPFLPVDRFARIDAQGSLDWRFEMWKIVLPEVPRYLWLGKGYAINPTDLFLAQESVRRGIGSPYEGVLIGGDYHNGPLSLIIPFGLPGVLAFAGVLIAGGRVLYRNWKHGDPALRNINTVLFSLFITKLIFYVGVFGAFSTDLAVFVGFIGLSIAVNGDRRQEQLQTQTAPVPALVPAHA
jgi:O-antigen ligase